MPNAIDYVVLDAFLEAFRDAGYRGLAGALAELVDNSLEAGASRVDVDFQTRDDSVERITVMDNGSGMPPADLQLALQFGGSTRFDSRAGFGRYGIGLPGSSISQARRVDVYTWTNRRPHWFTYLSLDEVRIRGLDRIPRPTQVAPPVVIPDWAAEHGTLVVWSTCDRTPPLGRSARVALAHSLGQTFREALWSGVQIRLNGDVLVPVDPLFIRPGIAPSDAAPYGPPLVFDIDLPGRGRRRQAHVTARFSELPVETWTKLPSAEKRRTGITNNGGVSILRASREIDTGWFFMGEKRKESYDDWWRCEVCFAPELDEFFGVTHTKQGIHPRPDLTAILTPQISRVAHTLNGRVRRRFQRLRQRAVGTSKAVRRAERRDYLLEPPASESTTSACLRGFRGLRYEVVHQALAEPMFFRQEQRRGILRLTLNRAHPFHAALRGEVDGTSASDLIEFLLLAAARAERRLTTSGERAAVARHREHWSNALAAFLA